MHNICGAVVAVETIGGVGENACKCMVEKGRRGDGKRKGGRLTHEIAELEVVGGNAGKCLEM